MAQVVFVKPFDFRPEKEWRSIVEYQPSSEPQTVTRECADKAIKAGAAKAVKSKGKSNAKRSTTPQDKD